MTSGHDLCGQPHGLFGVGGVELGTGQGLLTPNLMTLGSGPAHAGEPFTRN